MRAAGDSAAETPFTVSPAASGLIALIRTCIRHRVRGSTRFTNLLARHLQALQHVPITINGHQQLFVDLRDGLSHDLLAGSPWASVPWEPDEQALMRRLVRENDTVYDIGAHIGLHMVLLSELVGPGGIVHAFEANPSKIPALRLTATHLPNTTVHGLALSDRDTRAELFVPEDETMASLRDWTEGRVGAIRRENCEMRQMDSLVNEGVLPLPDFIKCDVEGAELQVFSGGSRVLDSASAPIILYEANGGSAAAFGVTIAAATDFLRELPAPGYTFFHVQPAGELRPLERFTPDCDHYNLLAVPRSRMDRL